ncbi:MAG: putative quinol monooxygenase [Clostridiaceae bacterium]
MRIIAKKLIKEGELEKAIKLYEELVSLSRLEEGCVFYDLFQDDENSRILAVFEEWENKGALQRHQESSHFKRIVPLIGELTEKKLEMSSYHKVI